MTSKDKTYRSLNNLFANFKTLHRSTDIFQNDNLTLLGMSRQRSDHVGWSLNLQRGL